MDAVKEKVSPVEDGIDDKEPSDLVSRGGYDSSNDESEDNDEDSLDKSDEDIGLKF